MKTHAELVRSHATVLHIQEARRSRQTLDENLTSVIAAQHHQEWMALRASICPETYEERLSWYQENCLGGSARWLFDEEGFQQWADPNQDGVPSRWIFLHGIPGAGKSHLAATSVGHLRQSVQSSSLACPVLYSLVSHTSKLGLTALSLLKALLFQVAEDDSDLQLYLLKSKIGDLRGNAKHLTDLLQVALQPTSDMSDQIGPYIVIDGVDEMDEKERTQLLRQLQDISDTCSSLRIMISSRSEHDIAATLEKRQAIAICVNSRNEDSIEQYVKHHLDKWLSSRGVIGGDEVEVRQLLHNLHRQAEGEWVCAIRVFK